VTPACGVCGYAVEWLRSCYRGKWRLFKDRPDIVTAGRYVFADGKPHYPGVHNLGSANWMADEGVRPAGALGEVAYDGWDNGMSAVALPPAGRIGDEGCIADGERWPLPVIDRTFPGGWDSRCWLLPLPMPPAVPAIDAVDIEPRPNALTYAQILDALYTDPAAATAMLQAFLGPSAVITAVPNDASLIPGSLVAVTPDYTVVIVSGTSTPEQLAVQAMYAGGGPVNYGAWGTNPQWLAAAYAMNDRIAAAGADPNKPIIFAGHSYGGAAAAVLSVIYTTANPSRDIRLITFGMPKPGDERLTGILAGISAIHYVNNGDPVPYLPPTGYDLWPLIPLVPSPFWSAWDQWRTPASQRFLDDQGAVSQQRLYTVLFAVMAGIAAVAVAGTPMPAFDWHDIKKYILRLMMGI